MNKYAILQNPGHNRVYFEASKKLALLELCIATELLSVKCQNVCQEQICGVDYFTFTTDAPLKNDDDLILLSRLSFAYAIFEVDDDERVTFYPLTRTNAYYFNDDLSMILKYSGKTNELFTRFMLNLACMEHMKENPECSQALNILDPVCGKATSLFEGLIMGHNVFGVDIDKKAIHEAQIYFKKYLETGKYKHQVHSERISGKGNIFQSEKTKFELSKNKDDAKTGKALSLTLVSGNSLFTDCYFKKSTFDILIADLPYGVQHGSSSSSKGSPARNPSELIESCLPAWLKVLKPGAVIVLAWNNFVLSRANLEKIFTNQGLSIIEFPPHALEHRVDQAINRDVMVLKK